MHVVSIIDASIELSTLIEIVDTNLNSALMGEGRWRSLPREPFFYQYIESTGRKVCFVVLLDLETVDRIVVEK